MKAATISEIKKELQSQNEKDLVELCLRLAKYKKENKELLTYLLLDAGDEHGYIQSVKEFTDEKFAEIPKGHNIYLKVKMLRKILRNVNKFIKYSGHPATEVQLLIYYCTALRQSRISLENSTALFNMYERQLYKIKKGISKLHEDLQHDYEQELKELIINE